MKKSNIVLLKKNGKVKVAKRESDIFKYDCKYILIPMLDYDLNTFIMIKPKELLEFTTAEIEVTLQLKKFEGDHFPSIVEFANIKKSVNSVTEFINLIHSIDRMDYVNYITNSDVEYDFTEIIDIQKISIKIFRENTIIYNYKFESPYGDGYSNKSNCMIVTLELSKIYELKNKDLQSYKTNGFINIRNNRWSIDKFPDKNSLIGINLNISQTIFFTEYEVYELFNFCNCLKCESYVFNRDDIDLSIQEYEILDNIDDGTIEVYANSNPNNSTFTLMENDSIALLEFLIYLKIIYTITIVKFNMILFNVQDNPNTKFGFDMCLDLRIINKYKDELKLSITKNNIPKLDELIRKIYNTMR